MSFAEPTQPISGTQHVPAFSLGLVGGKLNHSSHILEVKEKDWDKAVSYCTNFFGKIKRQHCTDKKLV